MYYKQLESLIYNRISPIFNTSIYIEQLDLSLDSIIVPDPIAYIFQWGWVWEKVGTSAAFIDLTSAYDNS